MKETHRTFPKSERLTSKKLIEKLFTEGKSIRHFPFVIRYLPITDTDSDKVLFSVSKRNFKRAVDRNRIKRQMREIYRLNKESLSTSRQKYAIGYIYAFNQKMPFGELESKLKEVFHRLLVAWSHEDEA